MQKIIQKKRKIVWSTLYTRESITTHGHTSRRTHIQTNIVNKEQKKGVLLVVMATIAGKEDSVS